MKSKLKIPLGLAFIAFFFHCNLLQAQPNPTMDAQWTVKTNNGSQLVLELGIRTNTTHEHLGPAQFIFLFDDTYVKFNGGSTGPGANGTDYNWIDSFSPAVYTGSTGYDGSSSVSQPSSGTIVIELDFDGAPGAAISSTASYTPVVDLVFSVSCPTKSTTITWQMSEGDPPTFDNVTDDAYGSFDEGTFNGIVVNPLPVSLLDFRAQLKNSVTTLSWETASEINNDYFTVERSGDGLNFSPIIKVKGSGNSETRKEYSAYDESPLPDVSYYRLRQTDFNGASKTFNMVAVNNVYPTGTGINIISVSTSEAQPPVLSYSLPDDGPLTLMVMDINGKRLLKEQVPGKKGQNTYTFSAAATWKPGIYSIVLISKDQCATTKMIRP